MDYDKELKKGISEVKKGIRRLEDLGLKIEIHPTETMVGEVVNHIYVTDYLSGKLVLQKHLFTIEQK